MLQRNLPASCLLLLMPLRWLLNGLTLLAFLIQGRPRAAGKILSAHFGFLKWLFFVKRDVSPLSAPPIARLARIAKPAPPKKIALSHLGTDLQRTPSRFNIFYFTKKPSRSLLPNPIPEPFALRSSLSRPQSP